MVEEEHIYAKDDITNARHLFHYSVKAFWLKKMLTSGTWLTFWGHAELHRKKITNFTWDVLELMGLSDAYEKIYWISRFD